MGERCRFCGAPVSLYETHDCRLHGRATDHEVLERLDDALRATKQAANEADREAGVYRDPKRTQPGWHVGMQVCEECGDEWCQPLCPQCNDRRQEAGVRRADPEPCPECERLRVERRVLLDLADRLTADRAAALRCLQEAAGVDGCPACAWLQEYVGHDWPDEADRLRRERDDARAALRAAATSLRTLSYAGARDSTLEDLVDVRGYANSRATVARAALGEETP